MSANSAPQLAPGRYRVPAVSRSAIDRPRIEELLSVSVARSRVTVLSAPSGFGKTSAVSAWAGRVPGGVAWLSLGRFDGEARRLHTGVSLALRAFARAHPELELDELASFDPASADAASAFDVIVDAAEQAPRPLVLVVDEAHRAADAMSDGLLGSLIDDGPESLRLVLVGRTPLEAAVARALLAEPESLLGPAQLAFDADEVQRLAHRLEVAAAVDEVLGETGGWPIATRLVLMSGEVELASAPREDLLREYIRSHLLRNLPEELAEFVLDTSVSAEMTAPFAERLTGRADAGALLDECVRLGLFIEHTPGDAFRWHPVFARECRAILAQDRPDRLARLHRAAAEWLADDEPLGAVDHLLRAGDADGAIETILSRWAKLLVGVDAAALETVCATLPAPARDDPRILLVRAAVREVLAEPSAARMLYAEALARRGDAAADDGYEEIRALVETLVLSDRDAVREAATRARRLILDAGAAPVRDRAAVLYLLGWSELRRRDDPALVLELLTAARREAESAGDPVLARSATGHLAMALAWAGRLARARALLAELGDLSIDEEGPWAEYAGGAALTASAMTAYWSDDAATAERHALTVIHSGRGRESYAGIARLMLALAAATRSDASLRRRAAIELQGMPRVEEQGLSWPDFRRVSSAVLEEAAGHAERALSLASHYAESRDMPTMVVVAAGVVRRHGDPVAALRMLHNIRHLSDVSYVDVATLATTALVAHRAGDAAAAHELLERALGIAEGEGLRRPFCEDHLELRQLLADHLAWGTRHEDFISACLAVRAAGGPLESLSEREREVFDQLRTTRTMGEIAEQLGVSINTIKSHQQAIYRKLDVASRREAVRLFT